MTEREKHQTSCSTSSNYEYLINDIGHAMISSASLLVKCSEFSLKGYFFSSNLRWLDEL